MQVDDEYNCSNPLDDNSVPELALLWNIDNLVNRDIPNSKQSQLYNNSVLWDFNRMRNSLSAQIQHMSYCTQYRL
jgi:hypothetical protein